MVRLGTCGVARLGSGVAPSSTEQFVAAHVDRVAEVVCNVPAVILAVA